MGDQTAVEQYGRLHIEGTYLCGENGEKVVLKGVSTHGISLFPQYINREAFATFRSWGANVIRLAMYTKEEKGYLEDGDKKAIRQLIADGVEYATELGLYVLIDWHILLDNNPNANIDEAKTFWQEMSAQYKDHSNVIYEICNEPNGAEVTWMEVKKYAQEIIPIIRANDKQAVILVGTPTWSQDVDEAAKDPITGEDNLMYVLHFYAATHRQNLRDKAIEALGKGLPIFISEFGICDASGNGVIDYEEADMWMNFAKEYAISYICWNISNKDESSAYFKPFSTALSDWLQEELRETGKWIKNQLSIK